MPEWTDQLTRLMRESVNASAEAAVKFQKETWRLVDDLIKRGAVAKEEGQRLLETWTRRTEEFQEGMEEKYRQWDASVKAGLRGYLPPSRKEVEELHRKLDLLMANLEAISAKRPLGGRGQRKTRKAKAKPKAKPRTKPRTKPRAKTGRKRK